MQVSLDLALYISKASLRDDDLGIIYTDIKAYPKLLRPGLQIRKVKSVSEIAGQDISIKFQHYLFHPSQQLCFICHYFHICWQIRIFPSDNFTKLFSILDPKKSDHQDRIIFRIYFFF